MKTTTTRSSVPGVPPQLQSKQIKRPPCGAAFLEERKEDNMLYLILSVIIVVGDQFVKYLTTLNFSSGENLDIIPSVLRLTYCLLYTSRCV